MHEFFDSPDDVLAIKVSHRITGEDLDQIMDRLDAMFARHETVHMFAETESIESLELAALPHYFERAFPLFGMLHRFGRVAIVADQMWVRGWSRAESALLPFISYRVFKPEARNEAMAWAFGRETVN